MRRPLLRSLVRSVAHAFCLLAPLLAGCGASSDDGTVSKRGVVYTRGDLTVVVHPDEGTFDLARGATPVFAGAFADALLDDATGAGARTVSTRGCAMEARGGGAFACRTSAGELRLALDLPLGKRHATARLRFTNDGEAPVTVLKLAPVVVDAAEGGALYLGSHPSAHRVLENGRFLAFDTSAQLVAGDVEPFSLAFASPIPLRGRSVANWNHVVADVEDPSRSLVAGWLTFDRSIPTLGVGWDESLGAPAQGGRTPFTTWAAENALVFHGKRVGPGESLDSELLYLDPLPGDPLEGLERYASEVAEAQGIVPWTKRGPGHEVPNGWNSWTGGSATGGYGHDMTLRLFAENLDVSRRELAPFGQTWFQLDDGWQEAYGDWDFDPAKFPGGAGAVVDRVRAAGMKPGLWFAPFAVAQGSKLAAEHPGWLARKEDNLFGLAGASTSTLDVSNPEVRAFLADRAARIRQQGFPWVKVDYTYWALLGRCDGDPSMTNVEAYRAGWKAVRDALGPDTFVVGIGLQGLDVGRADGMRVTSDNGPKWDEDSPDDAIGTPRAFKGTVRTGARRWFYQDRVWVNHDDLLFFRSWPDPSVPPLSLEESRTFATWIALGGGIVKIGDSLVEVERHPEWIDVLRRLLPAWAPGTRPLDVLVRDYPEQYRGHVSAPAGEWDVVGLLHWGTNRDWTTNPPTPLGETTRTYRVTCDGDCLAYEFWSEEFLGAKSGSFGVDVEPRRAKVLALRPRLAVPQLLGTNRHVFQGATELGAVSWSEGRRTLSGTLVGAVGTAAAPWEWHLAFHAPAGFEVARAEVEGVTSPVVEQRGEVVRVRFSLPPAAQGETVAWRVVFR